jgi:hypothetical protein
MSKVTMPVAQGHIVRLNVSKITDEEMQAIDRIFKDECDLDESESFTDGEDSDEEEQDFVCCGTVIIEANDTEKKLTDRLSTRVWEYLERFVPISVEIFPPSIKTTYTMTKKDYASIGKEVFRSWEIKA